MIPADALLPDLPPPAIAADSASEAAAQTDWMILRPSSIHGTGGFARRDIAAGTRVIEYVGERITKPESARRCQDQNQYIFALDDEWDLDGNVDWNPARFINHSCEPNCEALCEAGRIWIVASREIREGEEVTFNYGYDLEDYEEHGCECGANGCVGFIVCEEFFGYVRQQQQIAMS